MTAPQEIITPPVDILESDNEIIYIFAIPGAGSQEVRIEIQQQLLEIEAALPHYQDSSQYTYLYRERPLGRYYRLLTLPPEVDSKEAVATFDQGLLEIRFPRAARGRASKVNVKPKVEKKAKSATAPKVDTSGNSFLL
ncbi:MAG: Hsp20/alpha crystallin family protein [Clostridia bacterium]|nr:Hsp20/alpha crystallin family protein [Clostridia bacterium]